MRITPGQVGRPAPRQEPRPNRLSLFLILTGILIGLRLVAAPARPAVAPATRPWTARVSSLNYMAGAPATLEVQLSMENASAEAARRVQLALLLPPGLKESMSRTAYWDPLLEGLEVDYWPPQTSRTLSFGLKLSRLNRDEAIRLLDQSTLRLTWMPEDMDPRGTRLTQSLSLADLWRSR